MFEWNDRYLVGCPDIDAEHKALFRLAQDLHEAMEAGRAQEELHSIFARLAAYTRFHFAAEEELMRREGFPSREAHAREHRELVQRVTELEEAFTGGRSRVDQGTLQLLQRWLNHHVLGSDQAVAEHLRDRKTDRPAPPGPRLT